MNLGYSLQRSVKVVKQIGTRNAKIANCLETMRMTFDLSITDEPIGFDASELVACPRCARRNGPDRSSCLYCGEALTVTNAKGHDLPLRKLEEWEPAFNLVLLPNGTRSDADVSSAAKLIDIDKNVLTSLLASVLPLPLARIESREVADELIKRLLELGFGLTTVPDSDLSIDRPQMRLRNVEIEDDQLVLTNFNSGEYLKIPIDNVCLIVTGRIVESRRDEVTKRKRGKSKIIDETQSGSELGLIDLYTSDETVGFRIQANGFDFSILGDEKGMMANANIEKLVAFLRQLCRNAVIADEYASVRGQLDAVWEPVMRKDVQVRSYGKKEFGASYTSSNLAQFTKYSRMRRLLI